MKATWVSLACALALGGCAAVDGGGQAGDVSQRVPATVGSRAVDGAMPLPAGTALAWRDMIVDPALKAAVELSLLNNRDLRVAALNIEATRAQYGIRSADMGPTVKAAATATAGTTRAATASLGVAAWELDLWGRLSSLKGAALATFLASEQTRDSVQASLVVSVAQAWLTLDADQQKRELTDKTLQSRERSLELIGRRRTLGAASALEVATARAAVETARGDLATLQAQVEQDLSGLRLLVGTELPTQALPVIRVANAGEASGNAAVQLVDVPAGLSSTVLLQRPDVRAAEQALQAGRANVAAARAARFPTLSLTTAVGRSSSDVGSLFSAGNGVWSFMPSLSLPIFDGGASRLAEEAARVQQQVLLANYDKAIQTAFKETADALIVRESMATRLQAQDALHAAYAETLRLVLARQQAGAETATAVLDAQRSLYAAQQGLIGLRLIEQGNRLTLFKVLGGR
ncbi:efflux transporter outer membrane subunit [Hydrogenophaga sp. PAMC20947]|uniref:efflux transporter outer membrane subunit n=1 Tax=Hydrogenophaga sp. PAMC20947 TaxID=2565558 RepID=UPI00109E27AA|nr:efflux transporter outer membrane subunit [Hydrogenophaga sp. PAMC20947]QCB46873.1 efflux transporter outer membrane subunit [Hydrogenophaga sp. PAMC20947]